MKLKTIHYEPHRCSHSFSTASRAARHVHILEWDMVTGARAEEVLEVRLSITAFERLVSAHGGNEEDARRDVVDEARGHIEHGLGSRLTHLASRLAPPVA